MTNSTQRINSTTVLALLQSIEQSSTLEGLRAAIIAHDAKSLELAGVPRQALIDTYTVDVENAKILHSAIVGCDQMVKALMADSSSVVWGAALTNQGINYTIVLDQSMSKVLGCLAVTL